MPYWTSLKFKYIDKVDITLLNLTDTKVPKEYPNMKSVIGDARCLKQYADKSFDFVFSNSVIEHVGDFKSQKKMSEEMLRVGRHGYLQTPNRYFFLEPHFLFPFFQFLPMKMKVYLLLHFDIGYYKKVGTIEEARSAIKSVRLLTLHELKMLFPKAQIHKEKIVGLTKSFYLWW